MRVLAVLGGQWGDEGKGKLVDLLSNRFDIVARYHGGHNAGHTVKFGNQHFALHLLPAGVVRGRESVIGPGVVVDLAALLGEIDTVRAAGVEIGENLLLSDRATVILPYHRLLDAAREMAAGDAKIGTTLRGIGPAYESLAARRAVRVAELYRPDTLASISERRIEKLLNPALSELPAFLVREGGLNSGLMMAQVTAAALVSECKILAHPASVDSIPTSAAKEDHVSMSTIAARKLAAIVDNLERVLAIELVSAFQAMEFLRPLTSSTPIERVRGVFRRKVKAWNADRELYPDLEAARLFLSSEAMARELARLQ